MNKYTLMGLCGGAGFLLVFLFGKSLPIAIIAGLLILVVSSFFISDKNKSGKDSSPSGISKYHPLLIKGRQQLDVFQYYTKQLSSDPLGVHIQILIDYCRKIFDSIETNPGNYNTLREVVEVYLPSLDKIIAQYIETRRNNLQGANAQEYVEKTRLFLTEMSKVFSKILDSVHSDEILEASVEIETMKMLMQGSGYMELSELQMNVEEESKS